MTNVTKVYDSADTSRASSLDGECEQDEGEVSNPGSPDPPKLKRPKQKLHWLCLHASVSTCIILVDMTTASSYVLHKVLWYSPKGGNFAPDSVRFDLHLHLSVDDVPDTSPCWFSSLT